MCGIAGFADFTKHSSEGTLADMAESLRHRGPDDSGILIEETDKARVGLGHRRLSILDLSQSGKQPMTFRHLTLIFNGEIYNFREVRSELRKRGHSFHSSSDTEVILHAFEEWGRECVYRFIGMFVFAIYDRREKKIFFFRDRAGVKPLYYYFKNGLFLFGSELKAIMKHPGFLKEIDPGAVKTYFHFGYIPTPYCIFQHTRKQEPGSIMILDLKYQELKTEIYWDATDYYGKPKLVLSYEEAKEKLESLLKSAYRYRMVADVPVGVFLSGGIDSTSVTALLQSEMTNKLKTFTIGFEEGNNEAPFARETARYLGTDHHEYICTDREAREIIPSLPYYYDEPFADSSAIPTILVSRLARRHVTVALSADGGDELFAGYGEYISLKKKLNLLNTIPSFLKMPAKNTLAALADFIPDSRVKLKHKINGISGALNTDRIQQSLDLFRLAGSLPESYTENLFAGRYPDYNTCFNTSANIFRHELEAPLAVDYRGYLQDDILVKVDRATMSVSLEGRDPLIDHRLLEFSARLPLKFKLKGYTQKRILKDILYGYIPEAMMGRPKTGFSLPILKWMRNDLSYLLDDYLDEKKISRSGLFNTPGVAGQVRLFKEDKLHHSTLIWKLLMFQLWYDRWM